MPGVRLRIYPRRPPSRDKDDAKLGRRHVDVRKTDICAGTGASAKVAQAAETAWVHRARVMALEFCKVFSICNAQGTRWHLAVLARAALKPDFGDDFIYFPASQTSSEHGCQDLPM